MNAGRFEQVGTPEEIYTGPPAHLLPAFRRGLPPARNDSLPARGRRRVVLAGGLRVAVRCAPALACGAAVDVFLRPEAIRLEADLHGATLADTAISGTVRAALFDGARSTLLVHAERVDAELRIAWPLSATETYPRGSALRLAIRADAGWAFAQ